MAGSDRPPHHRRIHQPGGDAVHADALVGKLADLVVLDTDPLACVQDRLKEVGVVRTFVGGRETFGPDLDDIGPVDGTPLD